MTHADTHTTLGLERITASLMHAPSPRLCHVPFRKLYTVYTRAPLIFIITAVFYLQLYSVSLITHLTHSPQTSQTGRTVLTVVTSQCATVVSLSAQIRETAVLAVARATC